MFYRIVLLWAASTLVCGLGVAAETQSYEQGDYRFEYGPEPAFVTPQQAPRTTKLARDGAAGSLFWWLIDTQVDQRGDGEVLYRVWVSEPLTAEAIKPAAEWNVEFDPSYQQLTIHELSVERDGKTEDRFAPGVVTLARRELEAERSGMHTGRVNALIVLPDVRVGDRVSVRYSLIGRHPVLGKRAGDHYFLATPALLAARRIRVLVDPDAAMVQKITPGYVLPTWTDHADRRELVYAADDIPALTLESDTPDWYDPFPSMDVAPQQSWADIATWAVGLYPQPQPLSPGLRNAVATIRKDHSEPAAQALAALRLVQDQIRYLSILLGESTHRPAEPNLVFERRYGDCKDKSRLLVTLLGELGIAAQPALVHSEMGPVLPDAFAHAGAFDHVIVRIKLPGKGVWVDPTATLQRGDFASQGFPNFGYALVVDPATTALVPMRATAPSQDGLHLSQRYVMADDRSSTLDVESVWRGAWAEWMRRQLASSGTKELAESWKERYASSYGKASALDALAVDDDETKNVLRITGRFKLSEFVQVKDGAERFEVGASLLSEVFPMPQTVQRKTPLALNFPARIEQSIRVEIADAYLPSVDVDRDDLSHPAFRFVQEAKLASNVLAADFMAESLGDSVPVAEVPEHLRLLRKMSDAQYFSVRLQRADARRSERKDRIRDLLKNAVNKPESSDGK